MIDYTGKKIGDWEVLERVASKRGARWRCKCACGTIRIKSGAALGSRQCKQCSNCQRALVKAAHDKCVQREIAIRAMYRAERSARAERCGRLQG